MVTGFTLDNCDILKYNRPCSKINTLESPQYSQDCLQYSSSKIVVAAYNVSYRSCTGS